MNIRPPFAFLFAVWPAAGKMDLSPKIPADYGTTKGALCGIFHLHVFHTNRVDFDQILHEQIAIAFWASHSQSPTGGLLLKKALFPPSKAYYVAL